MLASLAQTSVKRMRIGEQHKGEPVAVICAVHHDAVAHQPRIAAGARVAVNLAQVSHAMLHSVEILRSAKVAVRHRVVEYETRAAHQMASAHVVDRSVIL